MDIIISIVFISVTLFVVGFRWLGEGSGKPSAEDAILAAIWAALGTFFFYNLLM